MCFGCVYPFLDVEVGYSIIKKTNHVLVIFLFLRVAYKLSRYSVSNLLGYEQIELCT